MAEGWPAEGAFGPFEGGWVEGGWLEEGWAGDGFALPQASRVSPARIVVRGWMGPVARLLRPMRVTVHPSCRRAKI